MYGQRPSLQNRKAESCSVYEWNSVLGCLTFGLRSVPIFILVLACSPLQTSMNVLYQIRAVVNTIVPTMKADTTATVMQDTDS